MERGEYRRMAALEGTMWWYRALHAGLCQRLAALELPPGARLLDAGCGTGGLLRSVRRALPALLLYGVEYDPEAAAFAAARSDAEVTVGSLNALPYRDASFDAVVSADVLCHAKVDQASAQAELRRCLKPGGRLLLNLPAYGWMASAHDAHVHNARRYTAAGARALLRSAGFTVEAAGYWNSLLFPLMALHRLTVGRAKTASDVQAFPLPIDRLFFGVTAVERRLARWGLGLPFGGSVWLRARKP